MTSRRWLALVCLVGKSPVLASMSPEPIAEGVDRDTEPCHRRP